MALLIPKLLGHSRSSTVSQIVGSVLVLESVKSGGKVASKHELNHSKYC